jgi:hypothetical protein
MMLLEYAATYTYMNILAWENLTYITFNFQSRTTIHTPKQVVGLVKWDQYAMDSSFHWTQFPSVFTNTRNFQVNIVTCISDCRRGLDWWIDLSNTHKS